MKRLLFVCVRNACRSQMAEAIARMEAGDAVEAWSAGSAPSGVVNPKTIATMRELGYDLSTHRSKSLDDVPDMEFDAVVTMGCGDACPHIPARERYEWEIPNPQHMDEAAFREVRDEIARRVRRLLGGA